MSENTRKYNITDENLHKFIVASHSFVEEYSSLYSKLFLLDVFVDKVDFIDLSDIDAVDIFTHCIFELVKDIFSSASSLYSKSNLVDYNEYEGVQNNE